MQGRSREGSPWDQFAVADAQQSSHMLARAINPNRSAYAEKPPGGVG